MAVKKSDVFVRPRSNVVDALVNDWEPLIDKKLSGATTSPVVVWWSDMPWNKYQATETEYQQARTKLAEKYQDAGWVVEFKHQTYDWGTQPSSGPRIFDAPAGWLFS